MARLLPRELVAGALQWLQLVVLEVPWNPMEPQHVLPMLSFSVPIRRASKAMRCAEL